MELLEEKQRARRGVKTGEAKKKKSKSEQGGENLQGSPFPHLEGEINRERLSFQK